MLPNGGGVMAKNKRRSESRTRERPDAGCTRVLPRQAPSGPIRSRLHLTLWAGYAPTALYDIGMWLSCRNIA